MDKSSFIGGFLDQTKIDIFFELILYMFSTHQTTQLLYDNLCPIRSNCGDNLVQRCMKMIIENFKKSFNLPQILKNNELYTILHRMILVHLLYIVIYVMGQKFSSHQSCGLNSEKRIFRFLGRAQPCSPMSLL